jgi:hypothetical protein
MEKIIVCKVERPAQLNQRQADLASGVASLKAAGYDALLKSDAIEVQDLVITLNGGVRKNELEPVWLKSRNILAEVARFIDARS